MGLVSQFSRVPAVPLGLVALVFVLCSCFFIFFFGNDCKLFISIIIIFFYYYYYNFFFVCERVVEPLGQAPVLKLTINYYAGT